MAYNKAKEEYKWKLWKEKEEQILYEQGIFSKGNQPLHGSARTDGIYKTAEAEGENQKINRNIKYTATHFCGIITNSVV